MTREGHPYLPSWHTEEETVLEGSWTLLFMEFSPDISLGLLSFQEEIKD